MIGEFEYKAKSSGSTRMGAPSHEEFFIIHFIDAEEFGEMSIGRMRESFNRLRLNEF